MVVVRRFKVKRLASTIIIVFSAAFLFAASAPTITWSTLKTLNSAQTNSPAQALNNKTVSVPGFMVPLEDDADQVTEFLLVPFAGACIHVPPPPPNQMIYVKLGHNQKAKMSFTEPIMVVGQLHVATVQSPYGDVSFNMDGDSVQPYAQ
jgi:hypothetical protein